MEAILVPLRLGGIRVLNYLDNWLICAQAPAQAEAHTELVTDHLLRLGLAVNHATSQLTPSQTTFYPETSGLDGSSFSAHIELQPSIDSVSSLSKGTLLVETACPSTPRNSAGQSHLK